MIGRLTAADQAMWLLLAAEVDEHLATPSAAEDLFGDVTAEPRPTHTHDSQEASDE